MHKLEEFLKRKYTKTEAIGIIGIVFAMGACLDIILGNYNIFSMMFSIFLIFIGQRQRKKEKSLWGNTLLWMGGISLVVAIMTSLAFYLVIATVVIYGGYHLYKSASNPEKVKVKLEPEVVEVISNSEKKAFVKVEPFFKNMLVGEMRSIDESYELDDINIQYGFGDVHIDLTYTMIPEGETVILIRGLVGNIRLYVPYDVELSIQTSMLLGKINILEENHQTFNLTQKYQTKDYPTATRKIKIITSLLVGDIEVRNI